MWATPHIVTRAGHPDFLDLPWESAMTSWNHHRRLHLPKGISRHEVHFFGYEEGIYAIKELPLAPARNEYAMLRRLEELQAPAVRGVGLVERPWVDPGEEHAAAVITVYLQHAFSYRELLQGWGFGGRRNQMLGGFAELLVELHLLGCYWGDCSLSNVLYRYDADAIDVSMVDAETARIHEELSDGQRMDDIEIMIMNVAGGMADIAASQGVDVEAADLALGEDIAERYEALWAEVTDPVVVPRDEHYRITERINRLNEMGFEVADVELIPEAGGSRLKLDLTVGGRSYHSRHLRELTGVEATENQARQILSDLQNFKASRGLESQSVKALAAIRWRVEVFEPLIERIRQLEPLHTTDPVQAFCDFLHHRYLVSADAGRDVPNDEAFASWIEAGQPGFPLD
ncbi:MAG: DUF4032 domain-containing protein [Acidimicrobiia bacterium]|nr:DUF4032 domain-containing protein [Acidimicrobiia bacterium]